MSAPGSATTLSWPMLLLLLLAVSIRPPCAGYVCGRWVMMHSLS